MPMSALVCRLHFDQSGPLRVVADETGNAVKEITYDSFGNVLEDANPAFRVPIGFAGGLHDPDTGLVRFGYRDYDPDTGRFRRSTRWAALAGIRTGMGTVWMTR